MKNTSWLLAIIPMAALATLSVSCKPPEKASSDPTAKAVDQQIDKTKAAVDKADSNLSTYTFAQKAEFLAVMEKNMAEVNRNLDELSAIIDKSSMAVKAEAKPKLLVLRSQADLLNKQLDNVRNANASTWDIVKATTSDAYDGLKSGVLQARQWLSEKIAP